MNVKKGGMFGACIISVVLFVAIVGTVALDVQQETETVTKYKYITDTTGLFDYDKSPQYIDYDLVKNYTGYYTQDSQPYWGGVDYTTEETVNRYVLNLAPISTFDDDADLSDGGFSNIYSGMNVAFFGQDGSGHISASNYPVENYVNSLWTGATYNIHLADILTTYSITDYDSVVLTPASDSISDRILFCSLDDFTQEGARYRAGYTYADQLSDYPTWSPFFNQTVPVLTGCLSCEVDTITNTVKLYSSATPSSASLVKTIAMDKAVVVFGGNPADSGASSFGTTIHINAVQMPPNEYLDIKQGVQVL